MKSLSILLLGPEILGTLVNVLEWVHSFEDTMLVLDLMDKLVTKSVVNIRLISVKNYW